MPSNQSSLSKPLLRQGWGGFLINITRIIVGVLFIFSGLVKANDPLGLSYKMDEFFAVWNWNWAPRFSLAISIAMILFEVFAGVAMLLGWQPKWITRLLLLLIVFFTFLTGYAYLSGRFHSCGCFGDCIPITSGQSFTKDLLLLVLCVVLASGWQKIRPLFRPVVNTTLLMLNTMACLALMAFVLLHLPLKDCLPYAKGKNLSDQMKLPPGSLPDSTVIYYRYKKGNQTLRFDAGHFPADFDENSYTYLDREDVIVRPHTGMIAIQDFALKTVDGQDTTQAILHRNGRYLLFFARDFSGGQPDWQADFDRALTACKQKGIPLLLVTNMDHLANHYFNVEKKYNIAIVVCDGTPMKTFLRSNTGLVLMNGPVIVQKLNIRDAGKLAE